ncbi:hypothetical protein CP556_05515 [Natrinema sp. CBA1119]|uniref:SAM-dependent methyltransferase n=1 Tax=Natrinema sp. CBA1119 TaxID=1608465 RepID=UPI000BFA73DE|nr:class I SAM-dependent methyltransferase [Natrinema sp. CBA1119]PGF15631.1 hypothetical protein CP556_05515 [Natrinema sp. CBA1119]
MTDSDEAAADQASKPLRFPVSASRERWDREYVQYNAIPSSDRDDASKALVAAQAELDYESVDVAVDIGCGNGRNAVYLAKQGIDVIALDFSPEAVARTKERIAQSSVSDSVEVLLIDITAGLPIANDSVDLIVDSYLSCHFIEEVALENYFIEVRRALAPDGQFYWSGLGIGDEYYQSIANSHPAANVIVDPLNSIPKKLYDARNLDVELPFGGGPTLAMELIFEDEVAGDLYQRSIVSAVFDN